MAKRTPTRPRHASRGPKAAPRPRKAAAKKAPPSRAAGRPKAKAPKKAAPKKATPKKATPKKATPKKAAPKKVAPKKRQATARPTPKTRRAATRSPKPAPTRTRSRQPARTATRTPGKTSKKRPAAAAAPPRALKAERSRPRFEVALPLEPLAIVPVEDANGLPSHATPSSLSADVRRPARTRAGRDGVEAGGDAGSVLTGGDVDANWEVAYSSGDEAPGGDNPTPDQDDADAIGRALGVEYDDNEELQGAEKIAERDRHRWELDPASSDDYKARGR